MVILYIYKEIHEKYILPLQPNAFFFTKCLIKNDDCKQLSNFQRK